MVYDGILWFGTGILFFHILGRIIPTDYYCSEGLKPPTSVKTSYAEQDFPIFMAPFLSQSTCSYTLQDLFSPNVFPCFHYLHTCLHDMIFQCLFSLVSSFLDILGMFFSNFFQRFFQRFFPCYIKFHTCFFFPNVLCVSSNIVPFSHVCFPSSSKFSTCSHISSSHFPILFPLS